MASLANVGIPTVTPDTGAAPYQKATGATEAAFGAQTAQAAEGLGQTVLKVADYFGEVQVDDQANKLFELWNKRLRGDSEKMVRGPDGTMAPDTGYMGLRGQTALDQRNAFEKGLDDDLKAVRQGLMSPRQQAKFDDQTRRYRQHVMGLAGSHADQEARVYATNVNRARSSIALQHVATNAENFEEVKHGLADLIGARIREAQVIGGGPELIQAAKEGAIRDGTKTWLQAISATNPERAMVELEKNKAALGTEYDNLHREFRARKETQVGNRTGERAWLTTYTTHAPPPTVIPVLEQAAAANNVSTTLLMRTWQIESGGRLNPPDSETGAAGPFQFVGSTARQYGLKNPRDFGESANAAARLAADNKARLNASLGRVPTDAELYLAHQQGAGGAALLLNNPSVAAADALAPAFGGNRTEAARRIRVNGGDPNAPAANFTSMWAARFNGSGLQSETLVARKQAAFDSIESDPSLNDAERQHARTYVNRQFQALQISEGVTKQAKAEAVNAAADGYVKRILSKDPKQMAGIYEQISSDPAFSEDWRVRNALAGMAEKEANRGSDVQAAADLYGPGFWQAWQSLSAPPGDPARITDPVTLMQRAGPGGDLTLAGFKELKSRMEEMKKNPDAGIVHTTQTGLMSYAKSKLSFQGYGETLGFKGLSDPKGEAIFNAQFIPQFLWGYSEFMKKPGANPRDYLNQETVDKMIVGMRSRAQMEADRVGAMGEAAPGDKNAPPPPAPKGVDTKQWERIMAYPFTTADDKPYSKAILAQRLNMLISNPTPENIALFDQSQISERIGIDGKTLLERLGVLKPAAKPAAAAAVPSPKPNEPSSILTETESRRDSPEFEAARQRARAGIQRRVDEAEAMVR